jgi:hypothetical protein
MKKMFLFAAAAMVSLSSCVQTSEVYTGKLNEMGFKSAVTRGIIQSQTDMTYPIAVSAVLDDTDDSADNFKTYFDGAEFVYDEDTKLWKGVPTRYWPSKGIMQFLAFCPAPKSANLITNCSAVTGKIDNITVAGIDNNILDQHDVLYSDLLVVVAPQSAAQALQFYHALAQININFVKTDSAANVVLNSVLLEGVYFGGDLVFTPGVDGKCLAEWKNLDNAKNRFFNKATNGVTGVEDGNLNEPISSTTAYSPLPLLVIPMDHQAKMRITYTVDGHQNVSVVDLMVDNATGIPYDPAPKWEMGYKYTYNFTINVNEIQFKCTVQPWDDPDYNPGGSITI